MAITMSLAVNGICGERSVRTWTNVITIVMSMVKTKLSKVEY